MTDLQKRVTALEKQSKAKDFWDKLQSSGAVVGGALVAGIGAIATYSYNKRAQTAQGLQQTQDRIINRIKTVGEFLPFLGSNDKRRTEAALIAIAELGDDELATRFALLYRSEGGSSALSRLAEAGEPDVAVRAQATLEQLNHLVLDAVVVVFDQRGRVQGTGFYAGGRGYLVTASFVASDDDLAPREGLSIRRKDGKVYPASLIPSSFIVSSIAVLRSDDSVEPIRLDTSGDLHFGDRVQSFYYSRETGHGTWVSGSFEGIIDDVTFSISGMHIFPESAGAPVIDQGGNVIGMIVARRTGMSVAIAARAGAIIAALTDSGSVS